MKKKNQNLMIFGILVLLVIGGLFFSQQFSVVTSNTFIKPQWTRLECQPDDYASSKSIQINIESSRNLGIDKISAGSGTCGINEFTDSCSATINVESLKTSLATTNIKVFDCGATTNDCREIADSNTRGWFGTGQNLASIPIGGTIASGRRYYVEVSRTFSTPKGVILNMEYKKWRLNYYFGGGKNIVNTNNCCLPSSGGVLSLIPKKEETPSCFSRDGGPGSKWVNIVGDWNYGPATNVYTYQNKKVYCGIDHKLYGIATVEMKDGSIKEINPEYNQPDDTKQYFDTLGMAIKSVQCCPSEPNCNDNFEFDTAKVQDCFTDAQCFNAGDPVPVTSRSYVSYDCIQNKCIKSAPKTVECTTDSACGNGQVCTFELTNYGKCITQTGGQFCGDNKCDRSEAKESCPTDCGKPDDEKPFPTALLLIVLGIIVLVGMVLVYMNSKGGKRK